MQIRWFFEDIEPGAIRGPVATSEDGNYQIVFESRTPYYFIYYLYRNSDCIYAYDVCTIDHYFEFSEFLAKCHRKIERWEDKINPYICRNCRFLIFKDYEHHEGTCSITRLHRNFEDPCVHEEEKT